MTRVVLFYQRKRATTGRPYEIEKINSLGKKKKTENYRISRLTAHNQKVFCHVELVETSRGSVVWVAALFSPRGAILKQQPYPAAGKTKEVVSTRFLGFARNDKREFALAA